MSDDIKRIVDFELARGNTVRSFGAANGYLFIELLHPFHTDEPDFEGALTETVSPWTWEDPHYGDEKYAGFRSSIFPGDAVVVRERG